MKKALAYCLFVPAVIAAALVVAACFAVAFAIYMTLYAFYWSGCIVFNDTPVGPIKALDSLFNG